MIIWKLLNSSICPVYVTQTGTIYPGQSGHESNNNEEVIHMTQSSMSGASRSDSV